MTQETISKDQLKQQAPINTNHTKETLIQEVNISGLISHSLDSLFTSLAYGMDFLDVDADNKQIIPYATYKVDTSPYHENESVNLVFISLEHKDGQMLGRPLLRLIHKESAEAVAEFLNTYGSSEAVTASELFERANKQTLFDQVRTFISRTADILPYVDAGALYQAIEEYIVVSLVTDNYDVFEITSEDFAERLIDSLDEPDDGGDDDDTGSQDKKPNLRVIK